MKKIGKVFGIVAAILVAGLIVLMIALPHLVDPNNYKDAITRLVKEKTGRDLTIKGKIGLSFFPWLGVQFGQLELSNAPGFGPKPFAQTDTAGVKVKLLPLFKKQVVVDEILLKGLQLNLAKNRNGKTNWDDLTANTASNNSPAPAPPSGGKSQFAMNGFSVAGVDIAQANVVWQDQAAGTTTAVHNFSLKTGSISAEKPVDLKSAFDLESGKPATQTHVDIKGQLKYDLNNQSLQISNLNLEAAGLTLKADITGQHILDAPQFSGNLTLPPFNARTLLEKLGTKMNTRDPKALANVALKTQFTASAKQLQLSAFTATVDDSKFSGAFALENFAQPAYRFDLVLDGIDLDRYLPAPAAKTGAGNSTGNNTANNPSAEPGNTVIPMSAIRKLNADGSFRIGKLKAIGIHSSDVFIKLAAKDGLVSLSPTQAKLYRGTYKGGVSYDARAANPLLTINEQLASVQLLPFLKDADLTDKFSGAATADIKVTAHGLDAEQIKRTLNGSGGFSVQDGIIKGVDFGKMVAQIKAAVAQRGNVVQALATVVPQANDETQFSHLSGTAKVTNGIVANDDLNLQGPHIQITGKGTANLPQATVDYTANIDSYPLLITGPFVQLKFRPDWNTILRGQVHKQIDQEKSKARDQIKQDLNKRLKDLFNR